MIVNEDRVKYDSKINLEGFVWKWIWKCEVLVNCVCSVGMGMIKMVNDSGWGSNV